MHTRYQVRHAFHRIHLFVDKIIGKKKLCDKNEPLFSPSLLLVVSNSQLRGHTADSFPPPRPRLPFYLKKVLLFFIESGTQPSFFPPTRQLASINTYLNPIL